MYNHFYDNVLVLNSNMEKDTEWMKHASLGDFRYSFFPIIKPYEEDSVFCDTVPGFHLAGMRVGYPTFAWNTDWYREEELFEVQFAPYRSNNWVTVSTADSSSRRPTAPSRCAPSSTPTSTTRPASAPAGTTAARYTTR